MHICKNNNKGVFINLMYKPEKALEQKGSDSVKSGKRRGRRDEGE